VPEGFCERRWELARVHAVRCDLLGDRLEPHDLVYGGAAQPGELARLQESIPGQAGVDQKGLHAGGAEKPSVGLLAPERSAAGDVIAGIGAGGQPEHGRAAPAERDAEQRVERSATRRGPVRLGQERLELGTVKRSASNTVAMVVDQCAGHAQ
jgi:hypothetical protein